MTNCTDYRTPVYLPIAVVHSALGGLSFVACLLVIGLIILLKKYVFFTQRLILYLTLVAALNGLCTATQATIYFPETEAFAVYCMLNAFFYQITTWSQVAAICCITIDLMLNAVFQSRTRKEWVYIFMIFIFPLLFNWIPFIKSTYGPAGPWCWIRYENDDINCTENRFGLSLMVALWYGPIYPILALLLVAYIIILVFTRYKLKYYQGLRKAHPDYQKQKEIIKKEIRPLLAYPLIFMGIHIFSFINRINEIFSEPVIALYWLQAIITPLDGACIALVYILDKQTRKSLRRYKFRRDFKACCLKADKIDLYEMTTSKSDSLRKRSYSMVPYISSEALITTEHETSKV